MELDARSPAHLDHLYRDHWTPMVRLAYLLVDSQEAAQDVAQDAFVSFASRFESVGDADDPVSYLRTCVVNGSRSVLRKRRTVRQFEAKHVSSDLQSRSDEYDSVDTSILVIAAVLALPRRQREVIILRYWCDLPEAEIAAMLKVSCGTVKTATSRAKRAIQKTLKE